MELEKTVYSTYKKVRLADLEVGSLFQYENTIALKTEYRTNMTIECYIVGSGEFFWGGTNKAVDLNNLLVTPITIQ
jgi:hypothetical protein